MLSANTHNTKNIDMELLCSSSIACLSGSFGSINKGVGVDMLLGAFVVDVDTFGTRLVELSA